MTITNAMLGIRISKAMLNRLARLRGAKIFFTLDGVYITYKNKEYEFTGSNKNYKAWRLIN